jgi:hypothetical protein
MLLIGGLVHLAFFIGIYSVPQRHTHQHLPVQQLAPQPAHPNANATYAGQDDSLWPQERLAGLTSSERRGIPWNLQIEYSGETFFNG